MALKIDTKHYNSGLPYIAIEGLEKTKENEELATALVKALIPEIYGDETLNNWKRGVLEIVLEIRYATNTAEYHLLQQGIKNDKALPPDHPERSLLY